MSDIILRDSAYLQEKDAVFLDKHKATKHAPALPLYDSNDCERTLQRFRPQPFGKGVWLAKSVGTNGDPTLRFRSMSCPG